MNKLKYVFSHGKIALLILTVAVFFITSSVFDVISQLNSAKNGIEMLLVDVSLSIGNANELAKSAKKLTKVKYVGAATISEEDTRDYIKTVSDYSFSDYLTDITSVKNAEIIFVSESLLPEVYLMKNIVPLEIEGTFESVCYHNGVLYAFPLKNTYVTQYGSTVISLQESTYAVLLNGDHLNEARQYLINLATEEK